MGVTVRVWGSGMTPCGSQRVYAADFRKDLTMTHMRMPRWMRALEMLDAQCEALRLLVSVGRQARIQADASTADCV